LEIALYKKDMERWRKQAEEELRRTKEALQRLAESLEQRVAERTAELEKVNRRLQTEIAERKRGEAALRESEEKYRTLIAAANDAIFIADVETGVILEANRRAEELTGLSGKELVGLYHTQLFPAEEKECNKKLFEKYFRFKHSVTSEDIFVRHRDGRNIPVEISSAVIELGDKKIVQGIFRDITKRKEAEKELRAMSKVFMDAVDPIFIEDLDGNIIDVNAEAERAYGWGREELLGKAIDIIIPQEARKRQLELRPLCLQGEDVRGVECLRHSKSGKMFNVLLTLSLLTDDAGKPTAIATIAKDITTRKRAEETIAHMAYHDQLTGLPNRKLFSDRLTTAIAHAKRKKEMLSVMFLDIDRLKDINDRLGHLVGDLLLKAVAESLESCLRGEDTVARMGGDEFTLLLPEVVGTEGVTTVATKILEVVREPLILSGHELRTTASIGIALYPKDGKDADTLVRCADAAMYRAKEHGGNNFQFHKPA
ncbi:MAG: diguanylate cyclase, partial [Candidatus Brocadiales bacterium]|nr:diguanylate cyclase [Candidatus Bathyanammoxibius sp.]